MFFIFVYVLAWVTAGTTQQPYYNHSYSWATFGTDLCLQVIS